MALTFDDGPDPEWTPLLLDALGVHDVHATFFVMGGAAARHPDLIERTRAAGHDVQLHCHEHHRHTDVDRDALERDTDSALSVLAERGVEPSRWRTPWGVLGPWTQELARARGLTLTHWTADTEDWAGDPAPLLLDRVLGALRPGAIVLAHDGLGPGARRAGCEETVALVGPLVRAIRGAGLTAGPLPSLPEA
ncbi:MAG: polysaccharide deacetylase family protein, partial [Solirubrobacterales bacterium]|nr:polysaccharide deacetylase family protein [Solirubrobacterales bacterium]